MRTTEEKLVVAEQPVPSNESDQVEDSKVKKEHDPDTGVNPKPQSLSKEAQTQSILKKLEETPIEQLKEIITSQIDLEIRLKHKELKMTEAEVSKIESQMLVLRKFFDIPNDLKLSNEPNDFTLKYFEVLNKSLAVSFNDLQRQQMEAFGGGQNYSYSGKALFKPDYLAPEGNGSVFGGEGYGNDPGLAAFQQGGGHSYRTRSTTSSLRPSYSHISPPGQYTANPIKAQQNLGCLYRRTDGIVVRLKCPDCERSNFSSAQGFLNHSRIAHSKEYTSQDAAALKCGEILPEIRQDAEGEASLQVLKDRGLDPGRNLNVDEIYFNGLSNTLNTVHESLPSAKSSFSGYASPASDGSKSRANSDSPGLGDKNPKESVLLKKLVKEGKMKKDEYEKLLQETKKPVANAHLFENEVDEDEVISETTPEASSASADLKGKLKRRTSRGGININLHNSTLEKEEQHDEGEKENQLSKSDEKDAKRRRRA